MKADAVQPVSRFLVALVALGLVGCGSSSDSGSASVDEDDAVVLTPLSVASVGEFRGELATLADEQFVREELAGNADVNLPIVLDGADLAAINDAEWFSIKAAYREGWPVVLLQPTRKQIKTLIANLKVHLDVPTTTAELDAIGFQTTAVGDAEALFEYVNTDARPDQDLRVAAIGDWVAERQAGVVPPAPDVLAAVQQAVEAPELESVMGSLSRQGSLVVDRATHVVMVDAWAAHEFATGDDFYVFRLDTRSSGNNYTTRAFAETTGVGRNIQRAQPRLNRPADAICESMASGTSCLRERYLRRFEVSLFPFPAAESRALTLARVTPSSGRESESYMISTELNIGGSVNVGFSKEMGPNASVGLMAGLTVNQSRTISIPDATIVANHNQVNGNSTAWRFEMPDPPVLDRPGCPGSELRLPFPIQRGTHNTEQWAIYRTPSSARASLNDALRMSWRLTAAEGRRTLDWANAGVGAGNPGCNLLGCNCTPVTVHDAERNGGGTFTFPLADNTRDEPQRPQLSSISPTAASVGFPVMLRGSGLSRVTRIFFAGSEAQIFFVDSDSLITVLAPANATGTVPVTVFGNGGLSNAVQFRYN